MNQDKWFITRISEYKVRRNTNINNIANIFEEEGKQDNYFEISSEIEKNTLFMCYKFYSTFDCEGKGYISLKLIEEWAKAKNNELHQKLNETNTSVEYDMYKMAIQRVCNSIETYKSRYLASKNTEYSDNNKKKKDEEMVDTTDEFIPITISEFIQFCSPIFDNFSEFEMKKIKKSQPKTVPLHFKTLTETNISLTNYFGTAANVSPSGEFLTFLSSPSSYLEPTRNNSIKEIHKPVHNPAMYITDSNLYHSSFWSPCKNSKVASLLAWNKDSYDIQKTGNDS